VPTPVCLSVCKPSKCSTTLVRWSPPNQVFAERHQLHRRCPLADNRRRPSTTSSTVRFCFSASGFGPLCTRDSISALLFLPSALQVAPSSRAHPLACNEPQPRITAAIYSLRPRLPPSCLSTPRALRLSLVACCLTHKLHCLFVVSPATPDWPTHPGLAPSDVDLHDCLRETVFLASLAGCLDRASSGPHIVCDNTPLCMIGLF
jgi:hypothetical protein